MGSLTLPAHGSIYVDANTVIYTVEQIEPYFATLLPMWQNPTIRVVTSELTLLEVLVKPFKTGNKQLEANFRLLLQQSANVMLVPVTLDLLEQAASIRATTGLKTPDAIHAVTALALHVALFITNDNGFRRVQGLPIALLDEVIASP